MSGSGQGIQTHAKRPSPFVKLALAAGLTLVLLTVSVLVIREFVIEPNKTVMILPTEVAQQAQAVAQPVRRIGPSVAGNARPTFRGKVVDATTGDPIPNFQIRLGYTYVNNGVLNSQRSEPQNFLPTPQKAYHGGQYNLTSQYQLGTNAVWFVRIEAPGHMPVVSAAQHGSATLDFKLSPGKDIGGVVLDAGGAPVSGATVVLAFPGMNTSIDPASLSAQDTAVAVTGADGRYTFPPESGEIALAAMSDAGFAQDSTKDADSIPPLRLAAWGKINGKLIIAGHPAGDRQISIQSIDPYNRTGGRIYKSSQIQTSADGLFHFDRVAPGTMQISRMTRQNFPGGGYTLQPTESETVVVNAGQTLTVQIGGVGRPVTGKLILPPGAGNVKNYMVNSNVNGMTSTTPAELPSQMPANIKSGSQAAQEVWLQFFRITPAGQQWSQSHPAPQPVQRQYAVEMGEGTNFRIEDVVPGDYNMWLNLNPMQGGRSLSVQQQIQFTMPPVPGGYSTEPLVLPDIKLR
jgi:hypothetical protein